MANCMQASHNVRSMARCRGTGVCAHRQGTQVNDPCATGAQCRLRTLIASGRLGWTGPEASSRRGQWASCVAGLLGPAVARDSLWTLRQPSTRNSRSPHCRRAEKRAPALALTLHPAPISPLAHTAPVLLALAFIIRLSTLANCFLRPHGPQQRPRGPTAQTRLAS